MALREFMQNAIDIDTELNCGFNFEFSGGMASIRDYGKGFDLRHLAMGISEKSEGAIGQFGEGLKLGLLVYAREGHRVILETKNLSIKAMIVDHPDLGIPVLAFQVDQLPDGETVSGVRLIAECSAAEYYWAVDMFEKTWLNNPKTQIVHEYDRKKNGTGNFSGDKITLTLPGGRQYLNGQLMAEEDSIFTWHVWDRSKGQMNRDRTVHDSAVFERAVREIALSCTSSKVISPLVDMLLYPAKDGTGEAFAENTLEGSVYFYGNGGYKGYPGPKKWRGLIQSKFGTKTALYSDCGTDFDRQAEWEGWNVLECPGGWSGFLGDIIERTDNLVTVKPKLDTIPLENLHPIHLNRLLSAMRAVNKAMDDSGINNRKPALTIGKNVFVCQEIVKNGSCVDGLCVNENGGMIYLSHEILRSTTTLCKTILHEATHYHTRDGDLGSSFVKCIQDVAGHILASRVRQ